MQYFGMSKHGCGTEVNPMMSNTFVFGPSEGSSTPQTKHWCCLYSQFLHRNFFIAYN
jgi:hypothetical protein